MIALSTLWTAAVLMTAACGVPDDVSQEESPLVSAGASRPAAPVSRAAPWAMKVVRYGSKPNAAPAPEVGFSPQVLSFATRAVGTTSAVELITVTNSGDLTLNMTEVMTGDFAWGGVGTCGRTLAAGQSCTYSVTFTPTVAGNRAGSITVTDDAPGSPHVISLTGIGSQTAPSNTAHQFYVSPTGSDTNDGSAATPWRTIQHADAALTLGAGAGTCTAGGGWLTVPNAGACVHVLAGTYSPGSFETTKNGTATGQIYFISETRHGARIIDATWTLRGNWTNIEGFEMTGPSLANAVTVQTGNNKGVDFNYIHDVGTDSCTFAGIINQTNLPSHADHFVGNIIRHWGNAASSTCAQGYHGIYSDGDAVTITNNLISGGAGGWGIQRQYQPGHGSASDCAPGIISNNTIFNNQGGMVINEADVCPFSHWTVSNNIIVNNGVAGTCHGFNGHDCGGSSYGIDYWGLALGSNNAVSNNLIYGNLPADFANHGSTCTPGTTTCPASGNRSDPSTSVTFVSFNPDTNQTPASSYRASDYQLAAGSQAVAPNGTSTCAASPGLSPCAPERDYGAAPWNGSIGAWNSAP